MSDYFDQFNKSTIEFMQDREMRKLKDLLGEDGTWEGVIEEVSPIHTANGESYVFTVNTDPDGFYFANSIMITMLDKVFSDAKVDDLTKRKIKLFTATSKAGRDYIAFEFPKAL